MPDETGTTHRYHAEATALEGYLRLPFAQPIERQAHAKVHEDGGYLSLHSESFRVEGIVSYGAAHAQVSGHREEKHGRGFITLATSVVEDLNVLNVVTADRVVGQVSIEHPLDGYVPSVTFLGTQFINLRISGHPVKVDLDFDMFREQPEGDRSYTRHPGFMERVAGRLGLVRGHADIPEEIKTRYASDRRETADGETTEFSLVKHIDGSIPWRCFGHVIDIPHFGKVYLATVRVEHSNPEEGRDRHRQTLIDLTMIEIKMGCIATGTMMVANGKTNGGPTTGGN